MTIVGLDDTDSRERGMCTTYVAARLAERLRGEAAVERCCLVRLNPAIPYKTRGNAALAVHTDADPERASDLAHEAVAGAAETDDPNTNPGLVVAPGAPVAVPDPVVEFSRRALREELTRERARELCAEHGYHVEGWKAGRGVVGALAAVGAWRAWQEGEEGPTYEVISYRERERWGTERDVDLDSVFDAADREYPTVWDTVDAVEGEAVCVPHTPGPVLHGIRGDDPDACRRVVDAIEGEPVERRETFHTNQGTDAHLAPGRLGETVDGRGYLLDGTVASPPETRRGGHVFFDLSAGDETLTCAAFEPTKRFRDRVRALRVGDELTAVGEYTARRRDRAGGGNTARRRDRAGEGDSTGTLKLEKFAVRSLVRTEPVNPTCPDCGRRMESAGRGQGYRCRDCGTSAAEKAERPVERSLERGWYEVPPVARRHVAKPLVRGGFDAPTHPER
ncbi:tRNA(Ile)(2)-agmatinylcytidine synthase [Salinirubellus salinus]|uniref:tRNA(Ile2) 2-agmatinylcytidine synthetase TiaS n=1 Tax=Salinirubellus salinus TaxID=1364945 RepID=A0A9E7R7J8_9EURY|nr:tRNA(Ile)(2)-agmatinylcytidine synthase [Salinirubellus salinus]UWM56906.1 tRNA(Ile)(2)-agmatinylcytidine synthase [Salinirubellus salinus]